MFIEKNAIYVVLCQTIRDMRVFSYNCLYAV